MSRIDKFDDLRDAWVGCQACKLCENRVDPATEEELDDFQIIPSVGGSCDDEPPLIMFVVGGVDAEFFYKPVMDAKNSVPLEFLLECAGVDRDQAVATSIVLCPPKMPAHRGRRHYADTSMVPAPKSKEIRLCRERLLKEIEIFRPRMVVALGSSGYKALAYDGATYQVPGMSALKYQWALGQILTIPVPGAALTDDPDGPRSEFMQPFVTVHGLWEMNRREDVDREGSIWAESARMVEKAMRVAQLLYDAEAGPLDPKEVTQWALEDL